MEFVRNSPHQRFGLVPAYALVRKNPEALLFQRVLLYAVKIVQRRLRSPAYEQGGGDVRVRPVKNLFELLPIGNLFKLHILNGRARHNQAVEALFLYVLKVLVKPFKVLLFGVRALVGRRLYKRYVHLQRAV